MKDEFLELSVLKTKKLTISAGDQFSIGVF